MANTKTLNVVDFRKELEVLIRYYGNQKKVATKFNFSRSYINALVKGYKVPGPRILRAMKLKKVIGYVPL